MPRRPKPIPLDRLLKSLPPPVRVAVVILLVLALITAYAAREVVFGDGGDTGPPGSLTFCFWNVENLYDDVDDPAERQNDEENFFGTDPLAYRQKLENLAAAVTSMNGERGPDILAVCEVESEKALADLAAVLNGRLGATGYADRQYEHVAFVRDTTGRRIMAGVISRVKLLDSRTDQLDVRGRKGRVLRTQMRLNGHDLTVLASHWTSRLTDTTGEKRADYARAVYGAFKAACLANPEADVILCGDFNDEFRDESMQAHLHATDSAEVCRQALAEPRPLCLSANVDTRSAGTIMYRGRYQVFDHILVSRGLLDGRGWSVYPDSFRIHAPEWMRHQDGRPFRFGGRGAAERGYSDHFPVLVRLAVAGAEG